jgi:hypothetical protein
MHDQTDRRILALRRAGFALIGAAMFAAPPALAQRVAPPAVPVQASPAAPFALDLADAAILPPLALGTTVDVDLAPGQSAFFRLPEGSGDIVAQTRRLARGTDTVMALLDAQGRILAEDDDGGEETLASRLEVAGDQGGPLYLRVGILEDAAGRFELLLEAAPPADPSAPARTLADAATRPELIIGQAIPLTLRARQEAYFRIPASRQDLVALTRALQPGTDTTLALLDANGRDLAEDDDSGEENLASRIEIPAGQRRPVFLRARSIGGATGTFELVVLPDTTPAAPPFPRSLREAANAPALEVGQSVSLLLRRGQAAFYRLPEGDIAVLTRNLRRGADTVLSLINAEGQEIADDDDGGGGLASRLEVPASERRPLFIRASLLGDATGGFDLVVEADKPDGAPVPLSIAQATSAPALERGVRVPVRLRRGEAAVFRLPPGDHVAVTENLRDGTDTVLEIIDETGRVLAEDDDGGDGLASRLVVPAGRKGNLFLRASVIGGGAGAFDVVLMDARGR